MNNITQKINVLKYLYLTCTLLNWFSRFLPYTTRILPDPPYYMPTVGFGYFIGLDFSWIGMLINFLPIIELHKFNRRRAIIYGIIGSSIVILNTIIYIFLMLNFNTIESVIIIEYGYLINIGSIIGWCCLLVILSFIVIYREDLEMEAKIKKTILEFGTFMTRLKVIEISELTSANQENIIDVIKRMIGNQEIYAKYFKSSRSVVFNRLENMDKIDQLMEIYNAWENEVTRKYSMVKN